MTFAQASYNGKPTFELEEEAKHNPEVCAACCEAELRAFEANGYEQAPAPYFFERATVLFTKAKDWQTVAYWAEAYLNALELYRQNARPGSAKVWLSPKVEKLRERLEKARLKLG
jgi:hypothetical protein